MKRLLILLAFAFGACAAQEVEAPTAHLWSDCTSVYGINPEACQQAA